MQIHRAVVLVALMAVGIGVLLLLLSGAGGQSPVALVAVVALAAVGGVAFSWKRYFRR